MQTLRIKNQYLLGLASWLAELPLVGKESRMRTRFVNLLSERIKENQDIHRKILDKYVEKDKDGKMKEEEVNGIKTLVISEDKKESADKEYKELLDEEFVVDALEANKEMLEVIKDVVLNTDFVFGPKADDSPQQKVAKYRQSQDYEQWCQAFERS